MGQHSGNPLAQLKANTPPGHRVVRVLNLDEEHGMIPQIIPQLAINPTDKTITVQLAVHVIKSSAIIGGQTEGPVPLVDVCTVPWKAIADSFDVLYTKHDD